MDRSYTIGISCIGSGVGQSVINSLRLSGIPIKTVGLGTNPFAYGAYECHEYDYTPSIYEKDYIDQLIQKCLQHKIDLIIPGLDDEVLLFAQNTKKLIKAGILAIYPDEKFVSICRDKERMSIELNKIKDIFVKSYNIDTIEEQIKSGSANLPIIAKPKGGFASKGIKIIQSIDDLKNISDNHILQELAIPIKSDPNYEYFIEQIEKNKNPQVSEISIQVVIGPKGKLLGKMASYNKLNNGIPIEIIPFENKIIWTSINQLLPEFIKMGLRGPLNIQGRITEKGLKLFEMNPRFTGITGLRAIMGFNEVEACVKEWLNIDKGKNKLNLNYSKFGIRQTADKSIPIEYDEKVKNLYTTLNNGIVKKEKIILISGASGFLGYNLTKELEKKEEYIVWALGRDKQKLAKIFNNNIKLYTYKDIENGFLPIGYVDIFIHCAFARPFKSSAQIAESLNLTNDLFNRLGQHQVPAIINISSQSVYGQDTPPPWSEKNKPAPEIIYAEAKYSSELMLRSISKTHPHINITSLRFAAISGGQKRMVIEDLASKLVKQALDGENLTIYGENQQFELIDVRDAVSAIISLLEVDAKSWEQIYNVGSGEIHNLGYIAKKVAKKVNELDNKKNINVNIKKSKDQLSFGMDSTPFKETTLWKPEFSIEDIIDSIILHLNRTRS